MTPAEWAEKTAIEQGFPPQVTDPTTLARVAQIVTAGGTRRWTWAGPKATTAT